MNRTFYYARVSSFEQNLARQLESFAKLGAEEREIATDKESRKRLDCPEYVHSFSLRNDDDNDLLLDAIHIIS